MGLHHQLHALGERLGTDVFDDSESFRGALDDFLDEGAATTGEINLLVDTVRLGSYQRLLTMIKGGADPAAAVWSAGELLARERGSADLDGSRWACAVLGFAADKVPAAEVDRYDQGTQRPPGPADAVPPTATPPVSSPPRGPTSSPAPPGYQPGHGGVPPTAAAGTPRPFAHGPAESPVPATAQARPGHQPQPGYRGPQGPTPYDRRSGKKTPWALIVAAVVVVLALVAGGAWWALAGGDDDEPQVDDPVTTPTSPGPDTSPSTTQPSTTGPTENPLDFEAVGERYAALAPSLSDILFTCAETTTAIGEVEHLNCEASEGRKVELITFETSTGLESFRDYVVDYEIGSVHTVDEGRTYYSENPEGDSTKPSIYWDDTTALQSARLRGGALDELKSTLTGIEAAVAPPTKPGDEGLRTIISENLPTLNRCRRVENVDNGQTENNLCRNSGYYIYYGHYVDRRKLLSYRQAVLDVSNQHNGTINNWSYTGTPKVDEGKRIEWVDGKNNYAHLYWDVESCLCAVEVISLKDNQTRLYNWWLNAD